MIRLADKPNVDTSDSDYPFGAIIDDTGSNDGTPVNQEVYNDLHQLAEKIFDASGLTANNLQDNDANGYQLYEALEIITGRAPWTAGGALSINTSGGGTITLGGGDTVYNKYRVVGNTLYWQIKIAQATISGSPTQIVIDLPGVLNLAGYTFTNQLRQVGIYNSEANLIVTVDGGLGGDQLSLTKSGGGAFTNGTDDQSFDINIITEVSY